jgi:hypothetical protein
MDVGAGKAMDVPEFVEPPMLRLLIQEMTSVDADKRPALKDVSARLQTILNDLRSEGTKPKYLMLAWGVLPFVSAAKAPVCASMHDGVGARCAAAAHAEAEGPAIKVLPNMHIHVGVAQQRALKSLRTLQSISGHLISLPSREPNQRCGAGFYRIDLSWRGQCQVLRHCVCTDVNTWSPLTLHCEYVYGTYLF